MRALHAVKAWAAGLGGMLVAPVATLRDILADRRGTVLDPFLLAILVVVACYPATVARYAWLARVDVKMAVGKLLATQGFIWGRLQNQGLYVVAAAACFMAFGWLVEKRRYRVDACLAAGAYLYVPMGALALLGAALQHAGVSVPWLPHHPLDGWWVLEGGRVHVDRFYAKLGVEMAAPTLMGLGWAWDAWRGRTRQPPP